MKLEGKVAVITGGARGIGRAIAERYVEEGARVAIADLHIDEAKKTADVIGPAAIAVAVDVSRNSSIEHMTAFVADKLGSADILVNGAGIFGMAPLAEITEEDYEKQFAVNVRGQPEKQPMDTSAAPLASIGIDIGKEVFHLVGFGTDGKIAFRRKIKRLALVETFRKLPPCIIGMEACLSAHFVSRALRQLGHEPRIIPAIYVKPFVKGQKNDYNDAEAIAEAALRPNMRTVREKSQDQLDLQACHRVRSRLVSRRTATINQIRAFLIEQGIAVRSGSRALRNSLFAILKNREEEISPRMSDLIVGLYEDWLWLDERIETVTKEIEEISQREGNCTRLMSIPGVGPLISTAMVAAVGTGDAFNSGRDFGAWLGLVPRQYSTGDRSILGGISKRGNRYLRTLFIQAAKVLLMRPQNWEKFSFGPWLTNAAPRMHRNKLATALANKLARIAWSVLSTGKAFDTHLESEAI